MTATARTACNASSPRHRRSRFHRFALQTLLEVGLRGRGRQPVVRQLRQPLVTGRPAQLDVGSPEIARVVREARYNVVVTWQRRSMWEERRPAADVKDEHRGHVESAGGGALIGPSYARRLLVDGRRVYGDFVPVPSTEELPRTPNRRTASPS